MRSILFLLCLLIPNISWAVAYTSSGDGAWSVPATWGGGGVPGVGDSATIQAGHTITIDGNTSVGTSPASTVTYDLDISGTLYWPSNPAGNWTFTAYSSVRVQGAGKIQVGTSVNPLNCANTGIWEFATSAASQKYTMYIAGGNLKVYGCENFDTASGTVHRSRIAACAPACTAGAGRTLRLYPAVNWNASSGWSGDRILIGIGGNAAVAPAAGDDPEEITSWTAPADNQIAAVTLTEDHQIGDLVVNASRNFIIRSDSAAIHSRIYSAGIADPYDINWVLLDEMGDATNAAALMYNTSALSMGTVNHVAALNCEDGAAVACFYFNAASWTKIEGLIAFDYRGGNGIFLQTGLFLEQKTVQDLSAFEGPSALGYGITASGSLGDVLIDGFWCSHGSGCLQFTNSTFNVTNSILHGTTINAAALSESANYTRGMLQTIAYNEVRNSGASCFEMRGRSLHFYNNDIDSCGDFCVEIIPTQGTTYIISNDNTYDNCNTDNNAAQSGLFIDAYDFYYHGNRELFGQTTANYRSNIMWAPPQYTSAGGRGKGVCNECLLAAPANALTCGSMPSDGIYLESCSTGSSYVGYIPDDSYFALHNKDGVEYDIVGWGPGGSVISRDTVTNYTTSNIKMKITPTATNSHSYITAGSFYVADGASVTVDLYLRKDEAVATAGWRPRLALQGCGFNLYSDYDEMSDVNNIWEKVTVTGTADWRGVVYIYVAVRGKLSGVNGYTPVWPPTLDIYADGLSVTK